jgi:RNA polymerase sigma-70 factor (ECF subfamily)
MEPGAAQVSSELLGRCLLRDHNSWNEFIRLTYPNTIRLAMRLTRNREEARDLCQRVYLRLVDRGRDGRMRLAQYDPSKLPLLQFIKVVTYRCHFDTRRGRESKGERLRDPIDDHQGTLMSAAASDERVLLREYAEICDGLPAREGLAFALYLDGWAYREIARSMDISTGAAGAMIHGARQRLQAALTARGLATVASRLAPLGTSLTGKGAQP